MNAQNQGLRGKTRVELGLSLSFFFYRDNLMTDIYGANLYNRYLAQQHDAMRTKTKFVAEGTGGQVTMAVPEEDLMPSAAQCYSMLVSAAFVLILRFATTL